MSVAATVHAVSPGAWGDHDDPAWRVTVAVDHPTCWAPHGWLSFYVAGGGPCPLAVGDRVTVPVHVSGGQIEYTKPGLLTLQPLRVRMLGSVEDPDAPLH